MEGAGEGQIRTFHLRMRSKGPQIIPLGKYYFMDISCFLQNRNWFNGHIYNDNKINNESYNRNEK